MQTEKKQAPPYQRPEIVCLRLLAEQTVMTGSVFNESQTEALEEEIKFNW